MNTLSESNEELIRKMQDTIYSYESALSFNMKNIVRGLLYRLLLENDSNPEYNHGDRRVYMAQDLDRIIDAVIKTSHYTGGCESYPIWDDKSVRLEMSRVMEVLRKANVAL